MSVGVWRVGVGPVAAAPGRVLVVCEGCGVSHVAAESVGAALSGVAHDCEGAQE